MHRAIKLGHNKLLGTIQKCVTTVIRYNRDNLCNTGNLPLFCFYMFGGKMKLKLGCDSRFQRAFTACSCVFKVITLVLANQRNFFENATTCSKRMRKTLIVTQL